MISSTQRQPSSSPQRQAFEAEVARVTEIRGLARSEAEVVAFENHVSERLDANHPDSDPSRCLHGGRAETPDSLLLPIGAEPRHAWLHNHAMARASPRQGDR
jgi:hypothetical protein